MRSATVLCFAVAQLVAGAAFAQTDDIEAALKAADEAAAHPAGEPAPATDVPTGAADGKAPLPDIGEDQLAVFRLQRGFYFSSDLGIFLTFAGVRGYSNVQPFVTLKGGYDLNDYLSLELALAHGYSAGNAPSPADLPGAGGQETVNYSLLSVGGALVVALRPSARFAVEPKIGGGITNIYPRLTDPNDPGATQSPVAPHVMGGFDLKYLTLLTDFTAGVSFTGYYFIGPNIPALGTAVVVRYTF